MGAFYTFSILCFFMLIHLFANKANVLGWVWHGRFLAFASGVSLAYVFIDLLPALEFGQPILQNTFKGILPYLDRHAYLFALFGVLFFQGMQSPNKDSSKTFWASMAGYMMFNLFVGASLADEDNPDIHPLFLFAIAMGLHYFVFDHNLRQDHPSFYDSYGRWFLAAALFVGWIIGYFAEIPDPLIAIVVAFMAGGVLYNVMRFEMPQMEKKTNLFFILGALVYASILLKVGV
jgi:hypothetical protein